MEPRTLNGIEVSAIGLGCWAIGGPFAGTGGGAEFGWGTVDDAESVRAIHRGIEAGVTFFDTASNYGAGHSETVLGGAIRDRRDRVVIASKWGFTFDEATREAIGVDASVDYLRSCLEGSLRRLGTDYLDVYQLHIGDLPIDQALELIPALEELVAAGKLRAYGWSTDDAERAKAFAEAGQHVATVQVDMSVLRDAPAMIEVCEAAGLAAIIRGPLAMGLLSGKYHDGRSVGERDVRSQGHAWMTYFGQDGRGAPEWLAAVDEVRGILASNGRTLIQGALAWLWARSEVTVPIPGFRNAQQVAEIVGALDHGPLGSEEFAAVEKRLR
ncbi:MAG TPA: aldo/keto reductase [Actinospica sp.]|nr:aldo/keto reductase [Actinospica sp.]